MHDGGAELGGWLISGFQAQVALWLWVALVALYGFFRSAVDPQPDEIRPSGPVGL